MHLCEDVQKATEQKFSLFRESSKKKAKKKSTFLPSEKQQQQTNERRKGFGLFLIKSTRAKKSGRIVSRCGFRLTHKNTHNIFSTQQNGFFCQPRDDDDEHRGEEHFE